LHFLNIFVTFSYYLNNNFYYKFYGFGSYWDLLKINLFF